MHLFAFYIFFCSAPFLACVSTSLLLAPHCREIFCVIRHLQRLFEHLRSWRSLVFYVWQFSISCHYAPCLSFLCFSPRILCFYSASPATPWTLLGSTQHFDLWDFLLVAMHFPLRLQLHYLHFGGHPLNLDTLVIALHFLTFSFHE